MSQRSILCLPWSNGLARTGRLLMIAEHLRTLGAQVTFAGNGKYVLGEHSIVAERGFEVHPLLDLEPEQVLIGSFNIHSRLSAERFVDAELALYQRLEPDAVIHDYRPTIPTSALIAGLPSFAVNNTDYTNYGARKISAPVDHPLSKGFRTLLGKRLGQKAADSVAPVAASLLFRKAALPYNEIRRRHDRPRSRNILGLLEGSALNFLADAREWTPVKPLPANFRFVGPIIWSPTKAVERWEAVRARLDPNRPVIYATFGSTGRQEVFDLLFEQLGNRDEQVVLTTGGQLPAEVKGPSNFLVEPFLPGEAVMEVADLVICHGGSGSLYQAFLAGRPVFVVSMRGDQEWNADTVVQLGLGRGITAREALSNPAQMYPMIRETFDDSTLRRAARQFQDTLHAYGGPQRAAEEMLHWLDHHR